MSNCRRCHRNIVNKTSVQHGFGPVCWSKLNAQAYDERPMMFRITITDKKEASKSLARVRQIMGAALKSGTAARTTCMNCGEPLRPENIEYYDHEGGYDLPGFGQPQWLYHHCEGTKNGKKCNHDLSLWKLRIPDNILATAGVSDVSCLEHLDSTDAGGEPGDVGYKSLAEREA